MNYLKLVNCPVRGLFPEKSGKIDWALAGFSVVDVSRNISQGFIDTESKFHVSVLPIADEAKLLGSGIVDKVNTNAYENDTAEIITEEEVVILKASIEQIKATSTV